MDLLLVLLAIVVIIFFYKLITGRSDDLEISGIVHEKPWPLVGNIWSILSGKEGINHFIERNYWKYNNEKVFGFYQLMGAPSLVLRDPALIKQITIRDFDYFTDRHKAHNISIDKVFSKSLHALTGQKWRDMRTMLSPIYTTSNMKYMYNLLIDCIDDFTSVYVKKTEANGGELEIETQDFFARITADGIATTTLGFKGDCVVNENSEIYKVANDLDSDFKNPFTITITHMFPELFKLFGLQVLRKSVQNFFLTNIVDEIKRRREGKIVRPDVIQLLVKAKEGQLEFKEGDIVENNISESKTRKTNWTDEDLVAQALTFFLAGFGNTAFLMQIISYELAFNLDVQQTLIDEIDEILETLDGKTISYDQLNQMKFLDMVVQEALRKWPSFRTIPRCCTKDYVLKDDEGKTYSIKKGTRLFFPFAAIQTDPKYFPDPKKFDPYRFSDENKHKIVSGSFLTFGAGPRMCIGSRYALLKAKLLTFYILSKFSFIKTAKTVDVLTISKGASGFNEKIYVALELRK